MPHFYRYTSLRSAPYSEIPHTTSYATSTHPQPAPPRLPSCRHHRRTNLANAPPPPSPPSLRLLPHYPPEHCNPKHSTAPTTHA
eukprot:353300-Chlamydomonas_euryale.AAC.1